jgi:hypothetical protein
MEIGRDKWLIEGKFQVWKYSLNQVPAAHIYNPSYSGGRDQEDQSSKSAQENSLCETLSHKKPLQRRAGQVAQDVGPEFKPQNCKTKQNKKNSLSLRKLWLSWRTTQGGHSGQ